MKIKNYLLLILLAVLSFSCQDENESVTEDPKGNLTIASQLTKLFSRVAQNTTSKDNMLDKTSCFSVQLPVHLTVNGDYFNVSDSNDYQLVQDEIDEYNSDDDIIHFQYPITIKYKNYQTQVVSNETQFNHILSTCPVEDGFNEIECITINYPIVVSVYDSNNQLANTVAISNDTSLYTFTANLQSNVYYSVNYPISVVNPSGQTVTVTSNNQLEDLIQDAVDECGSGGSTGGTTFPQILSTGSWHISYCKYDDQVKTTYYNGYNFTFHSDYTITAVKNSTNYSGTWSKYVDGSHDILDLDFDGPELHELDDHWRITEYTTTEIRLKNESSGSGGSDYLYFVKN